MTNKYMKYPRTPHLPFSQGATSDDKVLKDFSFFDGKEVVITEKMDGENSSLYCDHCHARSLDSRHHLSRDWLKRLHGEIAHRIPYGYRVCGENLYAKHSIEYDNLSSYFYGFSVWDNETCLSWDDTLSWFGELHISPVNVLYRGVFTEQVVHDIVSSLDTNKQEGIVVRLADSFTYDEFGRSVAKWVRPNHITTEQHWMHDAITPNKLKVFGD